MPATVKAVSERRPTREGKVRKEFWLDPKTLRRAQTILGTADVRLNSLDLTLDGQRLGLFAIPAVKGGQQTVFGTGHDPDSHMKVRFLSWCSHRMAGCWLLRPKTGTSSFGKREHLLRLPCLNDNPTGLRRWHLHRITRTCSSAA